MNIRAKHDILSVFECVNIERSIKKLPVKLIDIGEIPFAVLRDTRASYSVMKKLSFEKFKMTYPLIGAEKSMVKSFNRVEFKIKGKSLNMDDYILVRVLYCYCVNRYRY